MAKVCPTCKKSYAANLAACPHCAEDALGGEDAPPKAPPAKHLEDSGAINLAPKGRIKTRRLPDPPGELPGHRATPGHLEGSEVELGGEPRAMGPRVQMPGSSSAGMGSEVNLGSLSEHRHEDRPQVVMPSTHGSNIDKPQPPAGSMLSQAGSEPPVAPADPKATQVAKQVGVPTMLAENMEGEVGTAPQDPKATKLAKQTAANTMLAEGMEQDVAGGPKATQLAKQTSPKTQLADMAGALPIPKNTQLAGRSGKPTQIAGAGAPQATSLAGGSKPTQLAQDELDAAMTENDKKTKLGAGVAAKTQLAAAKTPMTKLAKPDEQDMLRLPEKHQETKLAAGGTPMTKLASADEQDELRLADPDAPSVADAGLEETHFEDPAVDQEAEVEDEVEPRVVTAPAPKPKYLRRWVMAASSAWSARRRRHRPPRLQGGAARLGPQHVRPASRAEDHGRQQGRHRPGHRLSHIEDGTSVRPWASSPTCRRCHRSSLPAARQVAEAPVRERARNESRRPMMPVVEAQVDSPKPRTATAPSGSATSRRNQRPKGLELTSKGSAATRAIRTTRCFSAASIALSRCKAAMRPA